VYEPSSARQLDRRPTAESDDTEEFYRPEESRVGSHPGLEDAQTRSSKGGLRNLVTGTSTRENSKRGKKDRFAAMQQERTSRGYADYDRMDDDDRNGAREIDPNTLDHQF
jgi:hypothetical protein